MSKIPSIETRYNGYLFRSRTEARWAILFDELGMSYDFEPEGLSLPSGPYLPDFFLKKQKIWVEIKGTDPSELEIQRCRELSLASQQKVIMIIGSPRSYRLFLFDHDKGIRLHMNPDLIVPEWFSLGVVIFSKEQEDIMLTELLMVEEHKLSYYLRAWPFDQWLNMLDTPGDPQDPVLSNAFEKATYAQFEHGKTPVGSIDFAP